MFFQMEIESFPGLGRIKVHSTLHQIVSLDPRVNAFLSFDLEGFLFLSIWQEKGKSQFSVQVTAKQGLELELAFQPEHCAKTHQLFPPLSSACTSPWSGSLFLAVKSPAFPCISLGANGCQAGEQPLAAGFQMTRDGDSAWALLAFQRVT